MAAAGRALADCQRASTVIQTGGEGRGAAGGGSEKAALLEAAQRGALPLMLEAAPHHMAPDGSVAIPRK